MKKERKLQNFFIIGLNLSKEWNTSRETGYHESFSTNWLIDFKPFFLNNKSIASSK